MRIKVHRGVGVTLLLVAACMLLALLAVVEWRIVNDRAVPGFIAPVSAVEPTAPDESSVGEEFIMAERDSLNEMVERPLFVEGRRPLVIEESDEVEEPQVVAGKLKTQLMGVFTGDRGLIAIIKDRKGKFSRVWEGERLDGWLVKKVHPDRMEMVLGESTEVLELFKPRPKKKVRRKVVPKPKKKTVKANKKSVRINKKPPRALDNRTPPAHVIKQNAP